MFISRQYSLTSTRAGEWCVVLATACLLAGCGAGNKVDAMLSAAAKAAPDASGTQGQDVAVVTAPASKPAIDQEELRPRTHPAARGRSYSLLPAVEVALNETEKAYMTGMADAMGGAEKIYNELKKDAKGNMAFLRRALRSANREVRIQAAVMLGLLKDKSVETVDAVADSLILDRDQDVRAMAARSFLGIPARKAVDSLIISLEQDPYEAARSNAAWALGECGDKAAVPALRKALSDTDTNVRLKAASAVLKLKPKEAVPELIILLDDKSPMVRERARDALKTITGRDKGPKSENWK
jgi:hypothetical protein